MMTMSPAVQAVLDRLEDARQRWWVFSLLCNVLLMAWVSLAMLVAFVLLDVLLILPKVCLAAMFGFWCLTTAALMAVIGLRVFRHQRVIEAAARRVELSLPELGSDLINLIQLSHSANGAPEDFRQSAIAEAASWARAQHAEVRRLSLPRALLARVLEVLILVDRARYLEEHGRDVTIGLLFPANVSARNLVLASPISR